MDPDALFALIVFTGDPENINVDVVPTNWIFYDDKKDKLYCPFVDVCDEHNMKLLEALVEQQSPPLCSWQNYSVDIRGTARSYKEAIKKVQKLTKQPYVFTTENEEHAKKKSEEIKKQYKMKCLSNNAKRQAVLFNATKVDLKTNLSNVCTEKSRTLIKNIVDKENNKSKRFHEVMNEKAYTTADINALTYDNDDSTSEIVTRKRKRRELKSPVVQKKKDFLL